MTSDQEAEGICENVLTRGTTCFALTDLKLTVIAVVGADEFLSMDFFKLQIYSTKRGKGKLFKNVMFLFLYQQEFKSVFFFLC